MQGFEYVEGYAGCAAGKPRFCSGHVLLVNNSHVGRIAERIKKMQMQKVR